MGDLSVRWPRESRHVTISGRAKKKERSQVNTAQNYTGNSLQSHNNKGMR